MPQPEGRFMVVVAAIIENNGKVLLIKRSPTMAEYPNFWEDVGGRLKQFEPPEVGLKREIKEETGLEDIEIIKPLDVFHIYRGQEKRAENEVIGISFWCKTNTSEIILSKTHVDYQWLSVEEALEIAGHPALQRYLKIYSKERRNYSQ